jgi:hypothetical protein
MAQLDRLSPFGGVFVSTLWNGRARLTRHPAPPRTLTDPQSGRPLAIATVEVAGAICPSCEQRGEGGFVSFVADLRMVYACPACEALVWAAGA